MSSFTTIKVEFGSQTRRLAFESVSSWSAVRSQILSSYSIDENQNSVFSFHYVDEEGDLISVNSDGEFDEAVRCSKRQNKILKLSITKSEKAQENHEKTNLKVSVDGDENGNHPEINIKDDENNADLQEEEMDLPLDASDLVPRSPTLSDASDSSFVSINAQSLRDDILEKDEKQIIEDSVDSSQPLKAVSVEDETKCVATLLPATPSQPELIFTDREVVQSVMQQLAQDVIHLKVETPKSVFSPTVEQKSVVAAEPDKLVAESKNEKVEPYDPQLSTGSEGRPSVPVMKVKDLRSVIESVINEKVLVWLEDVLRVVDELDHSDEDIDRVRQLTSRIRLGMEVSDNRKHLQQVSDGIAKKMMRVMKQAEGKAPKAGKSHLKTVAKCDDEKQKGSAPLPASDPKINTVHSTTSPVSSTSSSSSMVGEVIHTSIACDGCGMRPLRGVRFHCLSCDQIAKVRNAGGYDLCEVCEGKGMHREVDGHSHVMIKFKQPTKFTVSVEGSNGPISGPAVYDVLRVNDDGTRTPFRTSQPIVALPIAKNEPASTTPSSTDAVQSSVNASSISRVEELEFRIRALETMIQGGEKKKAEKKVEKERARKLKEEHRKAQQAVKEAQREAKKKNQEERAAVKAAKKKLKEETKHTQKDDGAEEKKDDVKQPNDQPKVEIKTENAVESSPTTLDSAPATTASSAGPSNSSANPFAFAMPQFPFSEMVNSITSTVSNTFAAAYPNKPLTTNQPSAPPAPPAMPSQVPAAPVLTGPFSAVASNSSASSSAAASASTVSPSSIWSAPAVSAKRSLADVRAPAFFPYISQLRDLEAMGFDVDRSINALRYYRGDVQKAINSML